MARIAVLQFNQTYIRGAEDWMSTSSKDRRNDPRHSFNAPKRMRDREERNIYIYTYLLKAPILLKNMISQRHMGKNGLIHKQMA